jgi:hypothetical protein
VTAAPYILRATGFDCIYRPYISGCLFLPQDTSTTSSSSFKLYALLWEKLPCRLSLLNLSARFKVVQTWSLESPILSATLIQSPLKSTSLKHPNQQPNQLSRLSFSYFDTAHSQTTFLCSDANAVVIQFITTASHASFLILTDPLEAG